MRLTITTLTDHTFVLEVPDTLLLKTLKEFCATEFHTQPSEVVIVFDGHPLIGDGKKLRELNVKDGDFLVMLTRDEIKAAVRQGTSQHVEQLPQRLQDELRRQQQIHENMASALEHNPEMFGVVHMLYINCKINGFPTKAFVDSGAQTTLMSGPCAKRCNVSHLVDKRFSGVATGVGTQRIIGRIHMVQIQIENDFLVSSFCILQNQPMDVLLGLDMLKRHQCNIDLKRNVLRMGSGTETKFLPENELPQCARNAGGADANSPSSSAHNNTRKSINKAIQRSKNENASTSKGTQNKNNNQKK